MEKITSYILPVITAVIVIFGFAKGLKVFDCFVTGASRGLQSAVKLLPPLMGLVVGVTMLRQSGALEVITKMLLPLAKLTGIPSDVLPLTVLSPISGSGSLTMFEQILKNFGPDSVEGRVASVIMGSTETTFYAVTVYYGSVGIRKSGCTVPAALLADMTSFIVSAMSVSVFDI
ncbi:MAG: spore maturation protein [Clostridia bacterium]|nr:spore maturation protein [Clostridia bacterium]MBQ4626559.1 spore maturation protein [Clostridia bacterium]